LEDSSVFESFKQELELKLKLEEREDSDLILSLFTLLSMVVLSAAFI
jgi:hypothetical protein